MQFNRVTWYSKLLALILFIALPFAGFWLGMKYERSTSVLTESDSSTDSGYIQIIDTEELSVQTKYNDRLLKYKGRAQAPDSCNYNLTETTVVNEEITQIKIDIQKVPGGKEMICAQVVADLQFAGSVETAETSKVEVFFNDQKVN